MTEVIILATKRRGLAIFGQTSVTKEVWLKLFESYVIQFNRLAACSIVSWWWRGECPEDRGSQMTAKRGQVTAKRPESMDSSSPEPYST